MHNSVDSAPALHALVHACMDDLDELVDGFIAELAEMPPYQAESIPWPELRRDAEASFEMLLRRIADQPLPERLADISDRIGRRRAQAGVPLEMLLRAVRLDFRILWDALLRRAATDALRPLVDGAVTVWEAVEEHTVGVHVAYLDEAAVLARQREQERSQLVAALLASNGRDPAIRAQVATALELDPHERFAVAASHPANERTMREAVQHLRSGGANAHIHIEDRRPLLIAQLPDGSGGLPRHWLHDAPCALGPIAEGLAELPRSARIAVEIADVLDPDVTGPRRLSDVWTEVVTHRLAETGEALADEALSELDTVTEHERARLAETAVAFFVSGSVTETAKTLFCHRNTVLNRLHRLGELTGGQLTRPDHAALVALALRVRAQPGHAAPPTGPHLSAPATRSATR